MDSTQQEFNNQALAAALTAAQDSSLSIMQQAVFLRILRIPQTHTLEDILESYDDTDKDNIIQAINGLVEKRYVVAEDVDDEIMYSLSIERSDLTLLHE